MASSQENYAAKLEREILMLKQEIFMLKQEKNKTKPEEITTAPLFGTVSAVLVSCINNQKEKEEKADVWKKSLYKYLCDLESNNVGNVGEMLVQQICESQQIESSIDGTKTKQKGEKKGAGDGLIKKKKIEIKTARIGTTNRTFQHEMGEHPWISDYMVFVDVMPEEVYLVLFPNFPESHYKEKKKCEPYFPTISATWRKGGEGAFKLTTSETHNEDLIKLGNCIKITSHTTCEEVGAFINKVII